MTTQIFTAASPRSSLLRLLGAIRARHQAGIARRMERVTRSELAAFNDHMLRDIGLRRDEILDAAQAASWVIPSPGRPLLKWHL